MPAGRTARSQIAGALRLARFDAGGLTAFGRGGTDAARSFVAAAIALPLFLVWISIHGIGSTGSATLPTAVLFELLDYAVGWLLFPVVVWHVAVSFARDKRYAHFICAYNWSSLVQNLMFLVLDLITLGLGVSPAARAFLGLLLLIYVLLFGWFVAKQALDLTGYQATMVVGIDLMTSLVWDGLSDRLISAT